MYKIYSTIVLLTLTLAACNPNPSPSTINTLAATPQSQAKTTQPKIKLDTSELKYVMGHFNPKEDSKFIEIPISYADKKGMYMRKEAFESFRRMQAAALYSSVNLKIRSATRNFDYQKGIWERKWTGETKLSTGEDASKAYEVYTDRALNILKYSSMPGTSRHHWGTDVDFNSFDNKWFEEGDGLVLFNWLEENAHNYGFCRPYTAKDADRPHGYNEEKWHWSYTPISNELTAIAEAHLKDSMIKGFKGSEVAPALKVVEKYVLGINHGCRH